MRAVRVAGLGDVRVRSREGEVLRLRHVIGGACGRSVRTRQSRFSGEHELESWDVKGSVSDEGATLHTENLIVTQCGHIASHCSGRVGLPWSTERR